MRKLTFFVCLVLAVPMLLSGCVTDDGQNGPATSAQSSSSTALASADAYSNSPADTSANISTDVATTPSVTAAAYSPSASSLAPTEYRISTGDILDVTVFQVADLSKTVRVGEDGNITLPLIGKTPVVGQTVFAAEQRLTTALKAKYLQSPQVTINVKQYGQRVTVSGSVKTPKVMEVDGRITLAQAIAGAGGLGELADSKRIHIARTDGQHVRDQVYNLDAIQAGNAPDPVLQGGDLIVAEQSGTQVVLKNVKDLLPFAVLATVL
jgi:polysaccharide export outer membrane protein